MGKIDISVHTLSSFPFQIHVEEKAFSCQVCRLEFRHKNSLVRHMIRHTGERSYRCKACSAAFAARDTLKEHIIRSHVNGGRIEEAAATERTVQQQQQPLSAMVEEVTQPIQISPTPHQSIPQTPAQAQYSFITAPTTTTTYTNYTDLNGQTVLLPNLTWDAGQSFAQPVISYLNGTTTTTDPTTGAITFLPPASVMSNAAILTAPQTIFQPQPKVEIEVIDLSDADENPEKISPMPKENLVAIAMKEITDGFDEVPIEEPPETPPVKSPETETGPKATKTADLEGVGESLDHLKSFSAKLRELRRHSRKKSPDEEDELVEEGDNDDDEEPSSNKSEFKCERCGRIYKYKDFLRVHQRRPCSVSSSNS